jgi:hypothetical protein
LARAIHDAKIRGTFALKKEITRGFETLVFDAKSSEKGQINTAKASI